MRFTILCSRCGRIVSVAGKIWAFRLRHSDKNAKGHYLGWHCNRCAEAIECGTND